MEKECSACKFFDCISLVCMYDYRVYAILNGEKSARDCDYFKVGEFDEEELERTDYKW